MRISAPKTALTLGALMLASGAKGDIPANWHTFRSDQFNSYQLDIANVKLYDGRVVYSMRHIIGGRHTAQFVVVGDCTRKMRKEMFNSSLSQGPYIVVPLQVVQLDLNDVVDGSSADTDLRAACNWVTSGTLETPISTRIAALEKTQQELLQQRKKLQSHSESTESKEYMQRREAEIERRIREFNEDPKKTFISPSTREVGYAMYYHQVAQKIENVGTRDFPKEVAKSLYGEVIVSIPVFHDGTIYEKDGGPIVEKSSGIPMLDQAALNIARRAAPFDTFPKNMRTPERDDVWVITARFNFTQTDDTESALTQGNEESKDE